MGGLGSCEGWRLTGVIFGATTGTICCIYEVEQGHALNPPEGYRVLLMCAEKEVV